MALGSYQTKDDYQSCLYYSDLDFVLYYHDCIVDSDFSERVLIVDCLSTVGTRVAVADIELRRRIDTDNMA